MIYLERWGGTITEAREAPLSPKQDALARIKLLLTRWHLPGGYPFKLNALELKNRGAWTPHQVIFADFKASAEHKPDCYECPACHRSVRFTPGSYSFVEGAINFTVPAIGKWKCQKGHPGIIPTKEFKRYVDVGDQFKQYLQEKYGDYDAEYGRIIKRESS